MACAGRTCVRACARGAANAPGHARARARITHLAFALAPPPPLLPPADRPCRSCAAGGDVPAGGGALLPPPPAGTNGAADAAAASLLLEAAALRPPGRKGAADACRPDADDSAIAAARGEESALGLACCLLCAAHAQAILNLSSTADGGCAARGRISRAIGVGWAVRAPQTPREVPLHCLIAAQHEATHRLVPC